MSSKLKEIELEGCVDCGAPAVGIVWHNRDQKAYPMCEPCVDHNVTNRGGILLVAALQAKVKRA